MGEEVQDQAFDVAGIEKLFLKAKASGGAYAFAFGLAGKAEECGLAVHLRKPGAVLKKELKKSSSAIRKACFGTFTIDGTEVRFQTERPLKGLVKQLRKRFREAGMMKFKPILVGPDGAEIDEETLPDPEAYVEDDDEDLEAGASPASDAGDEAAPAPDAGALKARLAELRDRIAALPKDQVGPLAAAFAKAVGQLKAGDAAGAAATVEAIGKALDRIGAQPPPAAPAAASDATRLTAALAPMVPRIRALAAGPAQQALAQRARAAQALIASGDVQGAVAGLRELSAALAQAERGGPDAAESPLDVWNGAKETVDVGIEKLRQALRGIRHPDTDRIAEFGLAGLSGGGAHTRMTAALMSYDRAPAADRAEAAKAVADAMAEYRAFLGSNRLVALCEANPFGVAVDIRTTMDAALERISRTTGA